MEISDRLSEANARLKAANVNVSIEMDGGKLRLRATLPPRQGDGKSKQQRIPLNVTATQDGLKQAESEAHVVRRSLNMGCFNWGTYIKAELPKETPKSIGDWIEAFEIDYFQRRDRNQQSQTTWYGDYFQVFKRLPQTKPLSTDDLRRLILTTKPDTKTRKRYCMVLKALAKFAKLDFDPRSLSGKYSPTQTQQRDIPEDVTIVEWYHKLENPTWKWVFGMLAAYGLRNHEIYRVNLSPLKKGNPVITVLKGKTGSRSVYPIYEEWFEDFKLCEVKSPDADLTRTNVGLGNNVTHYFARKKIPFSPYDLRHAWAIRAELFGLPVSLAAQQMGHSVDVHGETYHHWINNKHQQQAYDAIMGRSDRPKPPIMPSD